MKRTCVSTRSDRYFYPILNKSAVSRQTFITVLKIKVALKSAEWERRCQCAQMDMTKAKGAFQDYANAPQMQTRFAQPEKNPEKPLCGKCELQ